MVKAVCHITRRYGKHDSLQIIENVSVINCPHYSENYLAAETMHEITRCHTSFHDLNFDFLHLG